MSTSSDLRDVAHLLVAIASECSAIGGEISQLGDLISESAAVADPGLIRLQSFDRITQNAHAQAGLIAHIVRVLLAGQAPDTNDLIRAIENMPLPEVRARLKHALGRRVEHVEATEDEIWTASLHATAGHA
ncbi:MAG TPA: hypothetical protein VG889_05245 [Rhizomicrobium sp.]|nr:hypothetical protein [Rhizomicrobium sp.]